MLRLFYSCGSSLNWDGYCNPEVDKLIDRQSEEADAARRKEVLWQIERKLAEVSPGRSSLPQGRDLLAALCQGFTRWRTASHTAGA